MELHVKSLSKSLEKHVPVLSDGTIHGVIQRTGVRQKGLGFNLCVAPPHDRVVLNFGVMEFTEVFQSRLEKMEETRGSQRRVHFVDIRTDPVIHDSFVEVSMGMYVSTKKKDNKTVMEHKSNDNPNGI